VKTLLRVAAAALGGNLIGYATFRFAAWWMPQQWAAVRAGDPLGEVMLLIAVTAMVFAAPPVIVGALAARVAGSYEPYIGLTSALWSISARLWWPVIPQLPAESWIAPMVLIMMSGMIGGWMVGGGLNKNRAA
jgi:hypothetical protein